MAERRTTSRRDFLKGRSAAGAVGDVIDTALRPLEALADSAAPVVPASASDAERYLVQITRPAMACQFAVLLNAGQYEQGADAALTALDLVEQLEEQLTVYRDTSEICDLNRRAAREEVAVEARLFALLQSAVQLSRDTDGAFDITTGPLVKVWGFYRRAGSIPTDEALQTALAAVGSEKVSFDDARQTIRFLREGVELNLGAIGKGYALDRAAESLLAEGVNDFLLHGGNSSVLARGSRGGACDGWTVGLADPHRPEHRLAEIRLVDRALATSGAAHQFFRHGGKRYGHILDPRTGRPAEGILSATAIAPTAAEADALSTAFYTLGVEAARDYCFERPGIGMVLLHPGKGGSSVEVTTVGLSAEQVQLLP